MTIETLTASQNFSRLMIAGIDTRRINSAPAGGLCLFGEAMGNGGGTAYVPDSEVIEFDVRKGNRGISSYIHRGVVGKPMNKAIHESGNFTTLARTFPLLADSGIVSAAQLLKRVFNENPYEPLDQYTRARRHCSLILEDIVLDHIYAMERSAWQMIKTGKMDLIFDTSDTNEQIDTKRDTDHTYTVTASWATAGTDILGNIDTVCTLGVEDAGGAYDVMVVGSSIPGYLAANTAIKAYAGLNAAGTSGFELVWFGENAQPAARYQYLIDNGYNPICRLRTPMGRTLNVFTYEGTYVNSAGTTVYYLTANEAVWFRSNAACDRQFGPPEKLEPTEQMRADWDQIFGFNPDAIQLPPNIAASPGVIVPEAFSCDIMRTTDNKAYEIICQAAPIFTTRDTDAFAYCEDVTSP